MNTCPIKQKHRAEKIATEIINNLFLNLDSELSTIDFLNKIKETFNSSKVLLQYFGSNNLKWLLSGKVPGSEIEPGIFSEEQIDQYFKEKETTVTEFNKSPITLNENWNKKSVEDLFKGSVANYNYLLQNFRYEFFHTAILKIDEENEENSKFINNNTNLNNELKNYLIKKFKQIQDYLKHQGYKISDQPLFTNKENVSKTYLETISIAIDLINNGNYFKLNYSTHPTDVNFLNNVIILTKLDELIGTNFNQLIGINGNYYKFITGNKNKYFFNDISQALGIYAEDDEMRHSVTNTQSELFSLVCSVIPMRDSNGKIIPNQFLNSNFVQQSAIKLKTELYNLFCNNRGYFNLNSNFQELITNLSKHLPKLKNDKFLISLSKYFENLDKIINRSKEKNLYFLDVFDLFGFEMEKVNVPVLNFFKNGEKNSYHIKTKETNEFFIDNLINQIKISISNGTPFEIFDNIDNLTLDFLQGISGEKFVQELQSLGINIPLLKTKIMNDPDELKSFKDFLRILKDVKVVEDAENLKVKASVLKIADSFSYYTDDIIGLQTWNSENKAIPTVRLSSSIFQDSYYIHRYRQTHGKLKETNILTEYPKFFSDELNVNYSYSTGIKIDAIKGKKTYKSAQSFTPTESLISEIKFGYFESLKNGIFEFQPVAYSDKATIFTKLINLHTEIKHNGKNISFLDLINKGPEELSKFYFKFQSNYYNSIKSDLLNLWNNIFQKEKGFKKFLTLDELNDFLYMQDFDQLQEKLINYLKDNPNIELVEERDYSIYKVSGQKKFALNKSLLKAITVNTNEDLFNETLDKRFKSFYSYLESNDILQHIQQTERLDPEKNSEINKTKLKTYLLLKNMFTEAYLSLTVGHPWIHASKKGMIYMSEEQFKDLKANELNLEESGRYAAHGKRNNIFTGSKEGYTLDSEKGIIRQVKCAIIDDTENEVYNLSGHIVKSKQLDGSLFAMKWTQDLLANSLPGRKQKGTQKNFTHHVGRNYSMQIKDAQFEIDNNWVRKSKDIDGQTTSFKNFIQNKLCLQISTDKDVFKGINLYSLLAKFPILFKDGEYRKIKNVTKDVTGKYLVTFDILNSSGDTINKNQIKLVDINTIYDIWDLFGAEYSGSFINNKFQFDETSMDIITQLMIKVKDDEGSKYLQESVIHIFGPKSAFKSGAVNVTPKEYFRNKEKLTYFTLDLGSSGLQNDKNHIVDEDSIKEMSQVISALAANGYTKDLADEAYTEIASIIESVVDQLQKSINDKSGDTKQKQKFYKDFSKKLIKAFKSANKLSLGQVILEVSKNSGIPFSDPNLYHKFISSILVGLNSDTIKRKYTGLAGILTPSDGIVKILEDENHKKYLLTDIYNESIKDENISEFKLANPDTIPTNDELFNFYLNKKFPKELEINSSDLNIGDWVKINGKDYNINNPIQLKIIQDSNEKVIKVFNKGRDLRPSIHTWDVIDNTGILKKRNIWSSPIVIISYFLNGYDGTKDELLNNFPELINKYQQYAAQYASLYGDNAIKQIQKQIQEYTIMLDNGADLKSELDFLRFLKISPELIPQNYETIEITNYEVQEAECILPAVYAKKFNVENKTLREVMDNAEEIFRNQIEPIYKEALQKTDLTVNVGSTQYGIRFIDFNLQKIPENLQDVTETYESEFIDGEEFFVDFEHNPLFKKDDNLRIVLDPQTEITYIYVSGNKVSDQTYLMQFLESFNSDFIRYTSEFSNAKSSRILEIVKKLNKNFSDVYKNYSSSQLKELDKALTKESTKFIDKLVQEKISTFELTQHIISSRIPAQSMQSFMAMENVGFTGSDLNNIYVSRWQIWIQGSDFDIDVAYNLMYSINKHGKLYDYSPYFDYTSYKTLQESLKLPKPNSNKKVIEIIEENGFTDLYNALNEERNTEFDKIKYLKNLKILLNLNEIKGTEEQLKFFKEIIDKHNKYSVNTESSKNLILSKIREISSNIKNMQSSYMSVDLTTGKFKKEAKDITNKEDETGNFPDMYNGYSNFELQQANYVGKKTVGIFANALKGFFALTQYFNTHPEAKVNKSVIVNGKPYDLKIANRNVNGITEELIQELEYASSCDLDLSAFLSLATDNAKELILGVLNAGQEFAGTYAYLLVCGVDLHDIVALLTSSEVKQLVQEVQGNVFDLSDKKQKTLSKLIKDSGNEQLEAIYNGAQEFRALTSILSINQGVKNTPHELISFKNSFQSIFNSQLHKKFKDKNYEDVEEFEVQALLDKLNEEGVIIKNPKIIVKDGVKQEVHEIYFKILDFNKFFKDENYRKLIIKMYDVIKDTFNIYEILSESKSFYNMLNATSLTDESLQKIALKYATVSQAQTRVQELFKKLPSDAFAGQFVRIISETQIKSLQNMIDHKLIYQWLNTDKVKKDFTFNVKDFYQYSGSTQSKKNEIIDLSTNEGILKFKELVENILIEQILKRSPYFYNNEFVRNLTQHVDKYDRGSWYKLKHKLTQSNDIRSQVVINSVYEGFEELKNIPIPIPNVSGKFLTFGSILYVYNLIATKNKLGEDKLSMIFESEIQDNPLIQDFLNFEATQDLENNANFLTDEEFLFALYETAGIVKIPKKANVLGEYINNTSENENYTDSDEPDSTSQLEEYEDIPNSESNEDSSSKDNENYNIYKVERAKGNEFKNLIKLKNSTPSYLKSELLNKLLNYIQSNSTIIKLECK